MRFRKIICGFLGTLVILPMMVVSNKVEDESTVENTDFSIVEFDSSNNLVDCFTEKEKVLYKDLYYVENNRIVFNDEKAQSDLYDTGKVCALRRNSEILNSITENVRYSRLNSEGEIVFDVPEFERVTDENAQDFKALWSANYLSANIWSLKFHLDSDLAMVFGIAGLIYRVINYAGGITGALKLTDDKLTNLAYTASFHIPMNIGCAAACNFIQSSACQALMNVIITGWNVLMIAAKTNPYSGIIYDIVMLALGLCLPSLTTSVQMIYNAGSLKKGVNCEFIYWLLSFNWWVD